MVKRSIFIRFLDIVWKCGKLKKISLSDEGFDSEKLGVDSQLHECTELLPYRVIRDKNNLSMYLF